MAQLYYRYSTMNAGKSLELIKVAYNYEERGKRVLVLTPSVDNRFGKNVVVSRVGAVREAVGVDEDTNILQLFMQENAKGKIDCVLIDECQFLKKHHVQATMVARVVDGEFVKEGEQIVVGGNDMYVSLCRKHYNDGRLNEKKDYSE